MDRTRGSGERARGPRRLGPVLGAALGAVVGFALGAAIYLLLVPVLERSAGAIQELEGPLWNIVPLLTIGGALAGWRRARRSVPPAPPGRADERREPPPGTTHLPWDAHD